MTPEKIIADVIAAYSEHTGRRGLYDQPLIIHAGMLDTIVSTIVRKLIEEGYLHGSEGSKKD